MSGSLIPDDLKVQEAIHKMLATELQCTRDLLQFGVALPSTKDPHECGLPHDTAVTAIALLIKASLSFRAAIKLCECGLDRSAEPVIRSLFETALNLVFLIRRRVSLHQFNDSKTKPKTPWPLHGKSLTPAFRTALYNAWSMLRDDKNVEGLKRTPGLKRAGRRIAKTLEDFDRPYVDVIGTEWEKRIKDANTTGLSIENLAASLSPQLRIWYRTVYAGHSKHVHQSDMFSYLEADQSSGTFFPRWFTSPKEVSTALQRASTLYLCCIEEMNKRYRYGAQASQQIRRVGAALRNWRSH
jgi:hypothetical protein